MVDDMMELSKKIIEVLEAHDISLCGEISERTYNNDGYDVELETYLMLEAKRNGFQGVPGVVDLVHNEEYKKSTLGEFADKLRELCK